MWKLKEALIIILYLVSFGAIYAQEKTFEREYTYRASELDSKISCRTIVLNQLRSTLLNEIGVYVQSESLLKTSDVNGKFSQDFIENISTMSAGVTKLQVIDETWNGETFWMKAAITVDEKELTESLRQLATDGQRIKEMENLRLQLDEATKELDNLRKRSNNIKSSSEEPAKKELDRLYTNQLNTLNAADYFLSGNSKQDLEDYQEAIDAYSKSIEMSPNNKDAYHNRGTAKGHTKDYRGALIDFNMAINIDPTYVLAYYNRANAKDDLGDYDGAIADYKRVIKLEPRNSNAFNNRGITKSHLKDYYGAIADYSKAIEINPEDSEVYFNRGLAKIKVGQKDSGCLDFNKAKELGNEGATEKIKRLCN